VTRTGVDQNVVVEVGCPQIGINVLRVSEVNLGYSIGKNFEEN
jgi:hypothetical protein